MVNSPFPPNLDVVILNAKLPSISEVWADDKGLLAKGHTNLVIDWKSSIPSNEDAVKIILQRQTNLMHPNSNDADLPSIDDITSSLIGEVERIIGAKFTEYPTVELVAADTALKRVNEILLDASRKVGFGGEALQYPRSMDFFPGNGTILVSDRYIMVDKGERGRKPTEVHFKWDSNYLKFRLFESLTYALLRQLRGEWKEEYIKLATLTRKPYLMGNKFVNDAVSQLATELAVERVPEWGVYAVGEKIDVFWGNRNVMPFYRVAKALSQKTLGQIAMADILQLDEPSSSLAIGFDKTHPYYTVKKMALLDSTKVAH